MIAGNGRSARASSSGRGLGSLVQDGEVRVVDEQALALFAGDLAEDAEALHVFDGGGKRDAGLTWRSAEESNDR